MSEKYKLIKPVPLLIKNSIFVFNRDTGEIFGVEKNGKKMEYALRPGLSGYLWLLRTEKGFFKKVK